MNVCIFKQKIIMERSSWDPEKKGGFKNSPQTTPWSGFAIIQGEGGHQPTTWGQWWFTVVDVGVGCSMYICPFEKLLISNWLRA